jgi:hypothetical protein
LSFRVEPESQPETLHSQADRRDELMLEDVLAILSFTPGKVRREIRDLSARQMKNRVALNKWSVRKILAHLDDAEEVGMRARVAAMIEQYRPTLFDQGARIVEMEYDQKDPLASLTHLTRQRRANVKWLRTLQPAQLKRRGVHERWERSQRAR